MTEPPPTKRPRHIAIYGKGGSGKSTIVANLAILFGQAGKRVLLIGCDPKHDTTIKVCDVYPFPTVLGQYLERHDRLRSTDYVIPGRSNVTCVEAGGPEPGIGCAGRGISKMFELFEVGGLWDADHDIVLYDVLGDVVCGGFAVPLRHSGATEVLVVVSGEVMALYAANNICRAVVRLGARGAKLAGFIGNLRGVEDEERALERFAERLGGRLLHNVPRDNIVIEAESLRQTVVEHAPESAQAEHYRALFRAVDALDPGDGTVPNPMGDLGFDQFIRDLMRGAA